MFVSGKPLRSSYRVIARDGRVVWFHCDARMVRRPDGQPWFIHGVAFDISDMKHSEKALQQERNVVSAILDTVGALVTVLDPEGRILRFNRACELTTGYSLEEVRGKSHLGFFPAPRRNATFQRRHQPVERRPLAAGLSKSLGNPPWHQSPRRLVKFHVAR